MIIKILLAVYVFMTCACLLFLKGYKNRIRKYFEGRDDVIMQFKGQTINYVDISTNGGHLIRCFIPILRLPVIKYNIISDEEFAEESESVFEAFKRMVEMT